MQNTDNKNAAEARIVSNPHFARLLRQRLESRHGAGALRETLARLTDEELVNQWLRHEEQGRAHASRRRAEKEANAQEGA
jgi:hypothetical protein